MEDFRLISTDELIAEWNVDPRLTPLDPAHAFFRGTETWLWSASLAIPIPADDLPQSEIDRFMGAVRATEPS